MKKKLYAFIVMLCLFAISCFSGCTLLSKDVKAEQESPIVTVGERTVTTNDVVNAFYSYYVNNQYQLLTDPTTAMNSFYNSVVAQNVVIVEAKKLFKEGTITLADADYEDVWEAVYDHFQGNIDAYEKSLYAYYDINEESEDYPTRLKNDNNKKEAEIKYEEYDFEKGIVNEYNKEQQGTLPTVDSKIEDLINFLKTKFSKTQDDERTISDIEAEEIEIRAEAFDKYIAALMLSAKIDGKAYDKDTVLYEAVKKIVEAQEESKLFEEYKEYVNSLIIANTDNKLSPNAIVDKYIKLLMKDSEKNEVNANYIKVISSTNTESLVLYHNGSETTYFTVQHLLVQFDDKTSAILKEDPGYSTTSDIAFREYYENVVRKKYADALLKEYNGSLTVDEIDAMRVLSFRDAGTGILEYKNASGESYFNTTDKYSAKEVMAAYEDILTRNSGVDALQLFNKFSWEFSQDKGSLTNGLSNVLGYAISSNDYTHGGLAKDFADGARALYEKGQIGGYDYVVSDFGVHILALTGIYESGEVAEVVRYTEAEAEAGDGSFAAGDVNYAKTLENLQKAKISTLTNQTIYHYLYDMIRDELIGDSGLFFNEYVNKVVAEYRENGEVDQNKEWPTYEELLNALR